jgi:mono/diheme cytochrome c family protein
MLSRALSLATAMLLIGFAAPSSLIAPASAQNLEAGKSPGQLFNGNCGVCHKSARGLLKSVPPGQLPGFLRQQVVPSVAAVATTIT